MASGPVASAKTNRSIRTKCVIICAVLLVFTIMAIAFAAWNVFRAISEKTVSGWLFAAGYIIGAVLAVMYIMISMNAVFSTLMATDKRYVIFKSWDNGFVPYNTESKIPFIREFMPAKTEIIKIPIKEISHIFIGTRNFIKRNCVSEDFSIAVKAVETSSRSRRVIGRTDIICIETEHNECAFMSVSDFDTRAVAKVIQAVKRVKPDIEVSAASRAYRKLV